MVSNVGVMDNKSSRRFQKVSKSIYEKYVQKFLKVCKKIHEQYAWKFLKM
jgi:hypothetical protein